MPWDTFVPLFSLFDHALQSAVGESVTLVKLEAAFISEETPSGLWCNILDPPCRDDGGREVNIVLPSWLKSNTLVLHHRELSRLTNEKAEGVVLLIKGAKGHSVGMQVKDELKSNSCVHDVTLPFSSFDPLAFSSLDFGKLILEVNPEH